MSVRWLLSLFGLFLSTFALLALSGPGRIDIVDGQTRYEVARSLAEHGDSAIRNEHVWFGVFPGADGKQYTYYRFPHSLLGVPAIWIADAIGPVSEGRRQFCFVLVGAVSGGLLAVFFAVGLRDDGSSHAAAIGWAIAGVVCTPVWYYATSTFDEAFGATALVGAVIAARKARTLNSTGWVVASAAAIAIAFNCKQPLGGFVLLTAALADDPGLPWRTRLTRFAIAIVGAVLGALLHFGYFWLKFPPGQTPDHSKLLKLYAPNFPGDPLPALLALVVSPGAGLLLYAPTVLLTLAGMRVHWRRDPRAGWAGLAAAVAFVGLIVAMTIFKGDVAWGPRYLTPLIALGWLLVPAGAARSPRTLTATALIAGIAVQFLALSVDPHRLYLERRLPGAVLPPKVYFDPDLAHLIQRPREIREILQSRGAHAAAFTPSWQPTSAPPVIELIELNEIGPRQFAVFDTFRPWWASFQHLKEFERPIDLRLTIAVLGGLLAIGAWTLGTAVRAKGNLIHESIP